MIISLHLFLGGAALVCSKKPMLQAIDIRQPFRSWILTVGCYHGCWLLVDIIRVKLGFLQKCNGSQVVHLSWRQRFRDRVSMNNTDTKMAFRVLKDWTRQVTIWTIDEWTAAKVVKFLLTHSMGGFVSHLPYLAHAQQDFLFTFFVI